MTEFNPTPRPPKSRAAFDRVFKGPTPASIFNTRRPDDTDPPTEDTDNTGTETDSTRRLVRALFHPTENTEK